MPKMRNSEGQIEPGTTAPAAGELPVFEQANAVAAANIAVGQATGSGAAAEDVRGSAREAPGIGSGPAGSNVPGDILREGGGPRGAFRVPNPDELEAFQGLVRPIVRAELDRLGLSTGALVSAAAISPAQGAGLASDGYDLEITSKVEGFRRGGLAHPARPTQRRSSDFTAAQLQQIEREPNLIVRAV